MGGSVGQTALNVTVGAKTRWATIWSGVWLLVILAIFFGVALSLLLQLNQEAMDLAVVELIPREDGRFEERPSRATLTSHQVTVLDVYGSLMYAGARTLEARLPDPAGANAPVVVLRLRRRTSLGATRGVAGQGARPSGARE